MEHLGNPDFCMYVGITRQPLSREYLRWLLQHGAFRVNLTALLQADQQRMAAGVAAILQFALCCFGVLVHMLEVCFVLVLVLLISCLVLTCSSGLRSLSD